MWKNSQRYLEHCLYFDFPVCILLWLKKIGAKTFRFALVYYYKQLSYSVSGEYIQPARGREYIQSARGRKYIITSNCCRTHVAKTCSTPVDLGILSLMSSVMPSAKVYDVSKD
jgi:hypothetical protein